MIDKFGSRNRKKSRVPGPGSPYLSNNLILYFLTILILLFDELEPENYSHIIVISVSHFLWMVQIQVTKCSNLSSNTKWWPLLEWYDFGTISVCFLPKIYFFGFSCATVKLKITWQWLFYKYLVLLNSPRWNHLVFCAF